VRPVLPCNLDDRYELLAELGRGSHAIVYRARDRELDRDVAIKVLRQELVDSDVSERFRREVRLTSKLAHPHIAHVFGTGEWLGVPYFVTELAQGPSLAERLARERQLPLEDALDIGRQIAGALAHAHAKGIIHRDVKPANILLTPDGALLADFGVARAMVAAPGTLATSTGVAVGTLLYMSPEQLCADKDIDGRSDQYELALVIYEMLAGVPPHVAANAEGLRSLRIVAQHVPVHTHRSSVPLSISDALMRAMAPSPADRFRTIADFAKALELHETGARGRITGSQSIPTSPGSGAPTRRATLAGAAIGVLALGGIGVSQLRSGRDSERAIPADGAVRFAVTTRDGDAAQTARVANAVAMELRAWPQLRADTGRAARAAADVTVEVSVSSVRDGIQVVAAVPGATGATGSPRQLAMRFAAGGALEADSLTLFAARLLMATSVAPDSAPVLSVITSRATDAVREFAAGSRQLLRGELMAAEQAFLAAERHGSLPQAPLWRAILGSWRVPLQIRDWGESARASARDSLRLTVADALVAQGLSARADDRLVDACAAFKRATAIEGGSFAAWYGYGECQRIDSIVVRDARSPTGARFRTSYWSALNAYEQAIQRMPSPNLVGMFDRLPRVAMAMNNAARLGVLRPDRGAAQTYIGLPSLIADSVAVFPRTMEEFNSGATRSIPASYQQAVRRNRIRLLRTAELLARHAVKSFSAQLGLVRAMEYAGVSITSAGNRTISAIIDDARPLARARADSVDLSLADVRVRLRLADPVGARRAAQLAIQRAVRPSAGEAELLAPVALLIGDNSRAESLLVRSAVRSSERPEGFPMRLAQLSAAYTLRAASGRCEELTGLRAQLVGALQQSLARTEIDAAEVALLSTADRSRLTCLDAPVATALPADPLQSAFVLNRAGKHREVLASLHAMQARRAGAASSAVSWDARFAEMWLFYQSGDTATARTRVATAMESLGESLDVLLSGIDQVGAFHRMLAICAVVNGGPAADSVGRRCQRLRTALIERE
jgi:eukaryotic-like serine/threonine-protein kinase